MVRIRRFEERCVELYSASDDPRLPPPLHRRGGGRRRRDAGRSTADDAVVATYREHGHALARGVAAGAVMAEMFGKVEGCSRGRGGSMHLFDAARRFYGGNAIVGGGLPVASGWRSPTSCRAATAVTACFFGEGAVAEGEFHESMNLAALWELPVLFCCENNLYAMGTALDRSESETDLAVKAAGYEMPAWPVDGMDVRRRGGRPPDEACARDPRGRRARASSSCAPTGSGPTRCTTPSATATRRRSSAGSERDPIDAARGRADRATGLLDDDDVDADRGRGRGRDRRRRRVRRGRHARAGRGPHPLRVQRGRPSRERPPTARRCAQAIREALARDERVFLMGEDVGRYGGCFAVSQGLLEEFGPERVRDTPLSESAFVGAGIGAALGGMRPIVEIMTVNFSLLALDQIVNNAATLLHMSGGQLQRARS